MAFLYTNNEATERETKELIPFTIVPKPIRARRGARTHGPRDRDLAEVGRLTDCATQAPPNQYF